MNRVNPLADPIERKIAIIRSGKSQAQIARELHVSKVIVTHVIKDQRMSRRVRMAIARALGMPVEKIWPQNNKKKAA